MQRMNFYIDDALKEKMNEKQESLGIPFVVQIKKGLALYFDTVMPGKQFASDEEDYQDFRRRLINYEEWVAKLEVEESDNTPDRDDF